MGTFTTCWNWGSTLTIRSTRPYAWTQPICWHWDLSLSPASCSCSPFTSNFHLRKSSLIPTIPVSVCSRLSTIDTYLHEALLSWGNAVLDTFRSGRFGYSTTTTLVKMIVISQSCFLDWTHPDVRITTWESWIYMRIILCLQYFCTCCYPPAHHDQTPHSLMHFLLQKNSSIPTFSNCQICFFLDFPAS